MVEYLINRLKSGYIDYATIFSINLYKKFQSEINLRLVADGYANLIK